MSKGNLLISEMRSRLWDKNQSLLMLFCGYPGTAKSYDAIFFATGIDKNFNVSKNIFFTAKDIMNACYNAKKGQVFIFDEAGLGVPSREWYSIQNKIFGLFLQIFRYKNVGIIFTTPDISYIDVQARKLFNYVLETQYIDFNKNLAYAKIYELQHNALLNKTYKKFPSYTIDGKKYVFNKLAIPKLPKEICDEYEEFHQKHKDEIMLKMVNNSYFKKKQKKEKTEKEHKCSFVYKKKTNTWECRVCGKSVEKNPFVN